MDSRKTGPRLLSKRDLEADQCPNTMIRWTQPTCLDLPWPVSHWIKRKMKRNGRYGKKIKETEKWLKRPNVYVTEISKIETKTMQIEEKKRNRTKIYRAKSIFEYLLKYYRELKYHTWQHPRKSYEIYPWIQIQRPK